MAKDYTSVLVFGGVGVGLYLLYRHLQNTCAPGDSGLCSLYNSIFNPAPPVSLQVVAPAGIAPTTSSPPPSPPAPTGSLSGPALNLRNGLIAAWLGSQGKTWDATANPTLAVSDWDAFMTGDISPAAKPVGGSQSVTADDYVKLRVTQNLGLQGIGYSFYANSHVPMRWIHQGGY